MKIGVITDEVSQDFRTALEFAKEFDLDCVELRSAWEKGPFDYTREDIEKIKALSDEFGIPVVAISSPFYKCDYSEENIKIQNEKFRTLVEYAKILGVKKIRCFDFFKNPDVTRDMIIEAYKEPYALCEAEGITIGIETEPSTNTGCCAEAEELVRKMNKPYFKVLYDPGNNIYCTDEVPYPDGYEMIKDIMCHVHIKDAVKEGNTGRGVAVGEGEVKFKELFARLKADGYDGEVMLETHYRPEGEKKLSHATLLQPKGSAISEGGYGASYECMTNLKKIIAEA